MPWILDSQRTTSRRLNKAIEVRAVVRYDCGAAVSACQLFIEHLGYCIRDRFLILHPGLTEKALHVARLGKKVVQSKSSHLPDSLRASPSAV